MTLPIVFIEGIAFRKDRDHMDNPCVVATGAKADMEAAQAVLSRNGYEASYLEWTPEGWRVWGHRKSVEVSQAAWERVTAVLEDAKRVKRIRTEKRLRRVMR